MSLDKSGILKQFVEEVTSPFIGADNLVNHLLDIFKDTFNYQGYLTLILNEETNQYSFKYIHNLSKSNRQSILDLIEEGIIDWVLERKSPVILPCRETIDQLGIPTKDNFLIVPLISSGKGIGVIIALCSLEEELINQQTLKLLSLLSRLAAMAIEDIELRLNIERKVQELSTFLEASRILSSSLELDDILNSLLNLTLKEVKSEYGFLLLVDRKSRKLIPKISRGISLSKINKDLLASGKGILGWVARNGKPLLIDDYKNVRFYAPGEFTDLAPKTLLIVPIKTEKGMSGILALCNAIDNPFYTKNDLRIILALVSSASVAIDKSYLYEDLRQSFLDTIIALTKAIDAKDRYTRGHSQRVSEYSLSIAKKLNLPRREIEMLKFCGPLHDIGKVGIDEAILRKPSSLTTAEYEIIKEHPVVGENIIKHIGFLKEGLAILRHHHERYDGKGYPDGLKGKNIPILARIVAIADAFDSMISDRPYRKAFSPEEAIRRIKMGAGTQFDPEIVNVAITVFQEIIKDVAQKAL